MLSLQSYKLSIDYIQNCWDHKLTTNDIPPDINPFLPGNLQNASPGSKGLKLSAQVDNNWLIDLDKIPKQDPEATPKGAGYGWDPKPRQGVYLRFSVFQNYRKMSWQHCDCKILTKCIKSKKLLGISREDLLLFLREFLIFTGQVVFSFSRKIIWN